MCCEALRELMKDEIEEEKKNAAKQATENVRMTDIRELMRNLKLTAEQAMQALGIAEQDRAKYAVKL